MDTRYGDSRHSRFLSILLKGFYEIAFVMNSLIKEERKDRNLLSFKMLGVDMKMSG